MMSKKSFRLSEDLKHLIEAAVLLNHGKSGSEVIRKALQEFGERHNIESRKNS